VRRALVLVLSAAVAAAPAPAFAQAIGRAASVGTGSSAPILLPSLSAGSSPFAISLSPLLAPSLSPLTAPAPAPALTAIVLAAAAKAVAPVETVKPALAILSAAAKPEAPKPNESAETARERADAKFDGLAAKPKSDEVEGGTESSAVPLAEPSASPAAPNSEPPVPFGKRSAFKALTRTHFLGVFNDTALKTLFMVWVTGAVGGDKANLWIGATTAAFMLPYVAFSSFAGPLSDKLENAKLIRTLKVLEVVIIGAAVGLFAAGHILGPTVPVMLGLTGVLAMMGTHSAFLSPAKERMLTRIVAEAELGGATARYSVFTFTGIVLGMLAGTVLDVATGSPALSAAALLVVSGLGVWASRFLKTTPASAPAPKSVLRDFGSYLKGIRGSLAADWRAVREIKSIRLVVNGLAAYWFIASIGQINMPAFVKTTLGLSDLWLSGFLVALTAGIGAGSMAAEALQKKGVRPGLAVWGALAMAGFLFVLGALGPAAGLILCFVGAVGLGAGSGLFNVPLNAQLYAVTPAETRGRYLGAANFVIFAGLALSAVAFALFPAANMAFAALGLAWHLGPQAVFLTMSGAALLLAWKTRRALPDMKP
jgi:acyl-[acyl-carrier-protein]-phospholipid O-acyltransferase/long-chain-fatty-acid--[acyl-carrier-protein] ligase